MRRSLLGASHASSDVGDRARAELEVDEGDVRNPGQDAGSRHSRDMRRRLVEPVAQDREVVRPEVPDDADVLLVQPQVHPAHRDEVDVAELAAPDQVAHGVDGRAVEERMPRHQHDAGVRREPDQAHRLAGRGRERLLDEDVLAGGERRGGELEVGRHRRRDHDGLDIVVLEDLVEAFAHPGGGIAPAELLEPCGVGVADRDELEARAARRDCGRGSGPSSRGRRRRCGRANGSCRAPQPEELQRGLEQELQVEVEAPATGVGDVHVERLGEG